MTHELAHLVDSYAGVEHVRDGGVAGVVEADRADTLGLRDSALFVLALACLLPRPASALVDRAGAERLVGGLAEDEVAA